MSSRFFPIGGNGSHDQEEYNVQPGDLAPMFRTGVLMFNTESDGNRVTKYIRITDLGMSLIESLNPKTK
jgi:hypothetical protein